MQRNNPHTNTNTKGASGGVIQGYWIRTNVRTNEQHQNIQPNQKVTQISKQPEKTGTKFAIYRGAQ